MLIVALNIEVLSFTAGYRICRAVVLTDNARKCNAVVVTSKRNNSQMRN